MEQAIAIQGGIKPWTMNRPIGVRILISTRLLICVKYMSLNGVVCLGKGLNEPTYVLLPP